MINIGVVVHPSPPLIFSQYTSAHALPRARVLMSYRASETTSEDAFYSEHCAARWRDQRISRAPPRGSVDSSAARAVPTTLQSSFPSTSHSMHTAEFDCLQMPQFSVSASTRNTALCLDHFFFFMAFDLAAGGLAWTTSMTSSSSMSSDSGVAVWQSSVSPSKTRFTCLTSKS
jgi:hypothetical protein